MSSKERLRVAIAGLGMAGGVMAGVIARHPQLELTAAADHHEHLRRRFEHDHGRPTEDSVEALVRRADVDVLYIATPHALHAAHAELAARHGKHVVVEKPMALTLEDCDRMIRVAEAAGTVLIVGHTHSFDPAVTAMRELIESGRAGRPVLLHGFNYTNFLYRPRRPEELDPARGGGVLFNQMPHAFDTARLLVGKPVRSVRAMSAALDRARVVDGCVAAFIEFEGGAAASLVYNGYDRFDSDEWYGWIGASGQSKRPAHGAAQRELAGRDSNEEVRERQTRWSYGGDALKSPSFAGLPHFGQLIVSCERAEIRLAPQGLLFYDDTGAHEITLPQAGERPSHTAVWDELCASVSGGTKPRHDGAFARGTVELCLAVAESARTRSEIRLGGAITGEAAAGSASPLRRSQPWAV
jgi:phthalate 4,5-cis-dihydrodiol dehydrogenase